MKRYFKFPKWFRAFYPGAIWEIDVSERIIFLTFDDGPNEKSTPVLIDVLKNYNAKATFFCTGDNVQSHPDLYQQLLKEGHSVGNHTLSHLNGWKTNTDAYLKNVDDAASHIDSKLFRPPYGRLKPKQHKLLSRKGYQSIFWSMLTYDFDASLSAEKMSDKIKAMTKPGSIFVFHDTHKCLPIIENELPKLLNYWKGEGYAFNAINPKIQSN